MLVLFEVETVALSFVYRFYFNKYYSITSNFILAVYVENTVTSGVNHYKCVGYLNREHNTLTSKMHINHISSFVIGCLGLFVLLVTLRNILSIS